MIAQVTAKKVVNDQEIIEYCLKNEHLEVRFLNVGGAITKIALAEEGYDKNLVLNYENLEDYLVNDCYLNVLVGRTANRIVNGEFVLAGKKFQVDINSAPHNLHGGHQCLSNAFFEVVAVEDGYLLQTQLLHQEAGFPGNLQVKVYYRLVANQLRIVYEATTDLTTIVNLTQHAYFNLSGNLERTIYDHDLKIASGAVAEVDATSGFTGQLVPVAGTRFDFNALTTIDPTTKPAHYLFDNTGGYDHLYILDPQALTPVIFQDPASGRSLKITTTEPAMQFYAGNFITSELTFENGRAGVANLGACFETHKIPYDYASQILTPDDLYHQETTFEFCIKK